MENLHNRGKTQQFCKSSIVVKNSTIIGKLQTSRKTSTFIAKLHSCGKVQQLWEISTVVEKFNSLRKTLHSRKTPLLWKISIKILISCSTGRLHYIIILPQSSTIIETMKNEYAQKTIISSKLCLFFKCIKKFYAYYHQWSLTTFLTV